MKRIIAGICFVLIGCGFFLSCDSFDSSENSDCLVRFAAGSVANRQFGVGIDSTHIVLDSGLVLQGDATDYYSMIPNEYFVFTSFDGGTTWSDSIGPVNFESGKKYEVHGSGGVTFDIRETY